MDKCLATVFLSALVYCSAAQDRSLLTGRVTDSLYGNPLIGVSIVAGEGKGTISDPFGEYKLLIPAGKSNLTFHYLGYHTASLPVIAAGTDTIFLDVKMERSVTALDEIVISAARYEQKLSDVMVSVDIIKPERIANTSTTSLETILRQTPGVEILDGQPSIRGGSGYSYGAGSRVLVLIDELPILSGDVGDVKWDYLPIENIEQVEIIKGASSVLYGSSALNGVFNIRTRYPGMVPKTKLSLYSGLYLEPARKEMVWWDRNPFFTGFDFSHRRKIKNVDLVLGGNLFRDEGYREDEYQERGRVNVGIKHRNKKVKGLSYGINVYGMLIDKSDFLLWRDSGSGALRQNPQSVSPLTGSRYNLDPFISYYGKAGVQHSIRSRFFHIENDFAADPDKNNRSDQAYAEYRYHRNLSGKVEATLGTSGTWTRSIAALYGNHQSNTQAVFMQLDGRLLASLNTSVGLRFERYVLDGEVEYSKPVARAGLNLKLGEHSFLRASFGQGYRFPSIAEKYTATNVGSLKIFPNPSIVSESGWSTELGFKQGVKMGEWQGFLDLAAFWSEYRNMIEFVFDLYPVDPTIPPSLNDYGFMAQNTSRARIMGIEFSLFGNGKIGEIPLSLMAGYTYLYPVDMVARDTLGDSPSAFLKYRYRHSLKSDAEIEYRRFTFGCTFVLNSRMDRIDEVFTDPLFGNIILPGFPSYWKENNKAHAVLDVRVLCNITTKYSVGLILKNALNREFSGRPGDIQAPRNISLRLTADF